MNKEIIEYRIVNEIMIMVKVNEMIQEGWQPLGGMAANFQNNGNFQQTVYHQAMVMMGQ